MFFPKIPGLIYSAKITQTTVTQLIAWRAHLFYTLINLMLLIMTYSLKPFFKTEKMWFIVLGPLYAIIYLGIVGIFKSLKKKREFSHGN
jgi:hypothetical protein